MNPRREFFELEPQQAIRTLMEVARPYFFDLGEKSPRIAITDELSFGEFNYWIIFQVT